jgi:hypothetical protein
LTKYSDEILTNYIKPRLAYRIVVGENEDRYSHSMRVLAESTRDLCDQRFVHPWTRCNETNTHLIVNIPDMQLDTTISGCPGAIRAARHADASKIVEPQKRKSTKDYLIDVEYDEDSEEDDDDDDTEDQNSDDKRAGKHSKIRKETIKIMTGAHFTLKRLSKDDCETLDLPNNVTHYPVVTANTCNSGEPKLHFRDSLLWHW